MPLEEITVYDITISGIFRIVAKTPTDAVNKAKEWVESNSGRLSYSWVEETVHEEVEEA